MGESDTWQYGQYLLNRGCFYRVRYPVSLFDGCNSVFFVIWGVGGRWFWSVATCLDTLATYDSPTAQDSSALWGFF